MAGQETEVGGLKNERSLSPARRRVLLIQHQEFCTAKPTHTSCPRNGRAWLFGTARQPCGISWVSSCPCFVQLNHPGHLWVQACLGAGTFGCPIGSPSLLPAQAVPPCTFCLTTTTSGGERLNTVAAGGIPCGK